MIRWFQQDSSQILARPLFLQVVLCKFHSVFLTEEGVVLTCGHGRGGRLGHGREQSVVVSIFPLTNSIVRDDFCI